MVYANGNEPQQGWQTYLSTTTHSRIGVYETSRSKLPYIEFARAEDADGKPTHFWWCHPGKGKHQMCAGQFDVVQVATTLSAQPKTAHIRVWM